MPIWLARYLKVVVANSTMILRKNRKKGSFRAITISLSFSCDVVFVVSCAVWMSRDILVIIYRGDSLKGSFGRYLVSPVTRFVNARRRVRIWG